MGKIFLATIAGIAALLAQEPEQSGALSGIMSTVAAMNKALQGPDVSSLTAFFTPDGDLRIAGHVVAGPKAIAERLADRRPWSEVTPPRIENQSVRFVTPEVAIVDASWVQHGSMIVRRAQPVLLVMKKDGERWLVISLRLGTSYFANAQ